MEEQKHKTLKIATPWFFPGLPWLIGSALLIGLLIVTQPAHAAWTEPSQPPPGGNVAAPINVSSLSQVKSGSLEVQGGFAASIPVGNVAAVRGTAPDTSVAEPVTTGVQGLGGQASLGVSPQSTGVYGITTITPGSGVHAGVLGVAGANAANVVGVYGWDQNFATAYAGYFKGRVRVEGEICLTASGNCITAWPGGSGSYDPAQNIWNAENFPTGGNEPQNATINLSKPIFATALGIGPGTSLTAPGRPSQYTTLYADTVTGRVGIGNTAPGAKLQIEDSTAPPQVRILSGVATTRSAVAIGRTTNDIFLGVAGNANEFIVGAVAGDSILRALGGAKFHVAVSGMTPPTATFTPSGVGIKTLAPATEFFVTGRTKTTADLLVGGAFTTGTVAGSEICLNDSCIDGWSNLITNTTKFGAGGQTGGFYVTGSGRVGSDFTVDAGPLHLPTSSRTTYNNSIQSNAVVNGYNLSTRVIFGGNNTAQGIGFLEDDVANVIAVIDEDRRVHLGYAGNPTQICFYGSGAQQCANKLADFGGGGPGSYDPAQNIWNAENFPTGGNEPQNATINLSKPVFATALGIGPGTSLTAPGRPSQYTTLYANAVTGLVGIGSAAPTEKLDVDAGFSLLNSQGDTSNRNFGPVLWTDRAFGLELGYDEAWSTRLFTRDSDGIITFGQMPGGAALQIQFRERMRINANGNVGIGTTLPQNKLDVAGKAGFGSINVEVDVLVDADGTASPSVGTQQPIAENAALMPVEITDNLCADSITLPRDIRHDSNGCTVAGGTQSYIRNDDGAGYITVDSTWPWAFNDAEPCVGCAVNDGVYQVGQDLYIDSLPVSTADTIPSFYNTGSALFKNKIEVLDSSNQIARVNPATEDWNWVRVATVNYDGGCCGVKVSPWYNYALDPNKRVMAVRISGNSDDGGACVASFYSGGKPYFTAFNGQNMYMTDLDIDGNWYGFFCASGDFGFTTAAWGLDDIGAGRSLGPQSCGGAGAARYGYNKPMGLSSIPPTSSDRALTVSVAYNDGGGLHYVNCGVDVLYADETLSESRRFGPQQ